MPALDGSPLYRDEFSAQLARHDLGTLKRAPLQELQVNVGRLCNQACQHCHVDAGPKRTEIMAWATMERILDWARQSRTGKVDITGGAPELNANFRVFVDRFLALGYTVTSRCNLTVLFEPGQEDLAGWYAQRRIRLVASLPCYTKVNVDKQRGRGVFASSIRALKLLNEQGYGVRDGLELDLVYNPGGAFLPGPQTFLEADYKKRLNDEHGVRFNHLLTLTNLPINRFAHHLARSGQEAQYLELLRQNFNPETVDGLMCRHLISVDWRGIVYDCDFNQMLDLPLGGRGTQYLWDVDPARLEGRRIAVGRHCLGCTAGAGSSCGGALT